MKNITEYAWALVCALVCGVIIIHGVYEGFAGLALFGAAIAGVYFFSLGMKLGFDEAQNAYKELERELEGLIDTLTTVGDKNEH